ncbi:hypothetical protein ABFY48_24085 [Lysinibacillus pakistanensis]|uniref:hypothetical protein n=1 Tax=Lysinibacillus pakistanensis TaxID=759811 RepID=UPI003D2D4C1D
MINIQKLAKVAAIEAIGKMELEQANKEKEQRATRIKNTKKILNNYRQWVKYSSISPIPSYVVKLIERVLETYKISCINSKRPNIIRRYNMMYYYFIAKEKKGYTKLADKYYVNHRTVFKDIEKAVEDMSIFFYGIDGIEVITE